MLDMFPGILDNALKISAELSSVFNIGSENKILLYVLLCYMCV